MGADLTEIYDKLFSYCEANGFAGCDPFDGLNSRLFQLTALKQWRLARLAFLQLIKRSPVNLRSLVGVKTGVNPKGIALFALAELSRFRATRHEVHRKNAAALLETLRGLRIECGGS